MKSRERIILILAMVAVSYWLYDSFLSPGTPPGGTTDSLADSLAMAASLKEELDRGAFDPPAGVSEVMRRLELPWHEETFISSQTLAMLNRKEQETTRVALPEIDASRYFYSGFLGSGSQQVAIINGLDYLVGDHVDGLRVDRITASAVHLRQGDSTVAIPLVEE